MKRNSVYIVFILGGAILGERVSHAVPSHLWTSAMHVICVPSSMDHGTVPSFSFWASTCFQAVNGAFNRAWEENNKGVRTFDRLQHSSIGCGRSCCAVSAHHSLLVTAVVMLPQKLFKHIKTGGGEEEGGDDDE
jgi:Ubiquinol-cytochrome C reductase, UQCRX/QCR9 like